MPTLRTLGGKLIVRDEKLGTDDKCCCGCCCVDGEYDPALTTEAACTDAGGFWFAAEDNCAEDVVCDGCGCVFPIDLALSITFEVSVDLACGGNPVAGAVVVTLEPDNALGFYVGVGQIGGVDITCSFGCETDVADTFGVPPGKYWSYVVIDDCAAGPADIDDIGLHDIVEYELSDGTRICKPANGGGAYDGVSWTVTIEEVPP